MYLSTKCAKEMHFCESSNGLPPWPRKAFKYLYSYGFFADVTHEKKKRRTKEKEINANTIMQIL